MQGGLAGFLSYDLNRSLESIGNKQLDEFGLPALVLGCYDTLIAWDHEQERAWVISSGLPETNPDLRILRAKSRLKQFTEILATPENESISE